MKKKCGHERSQAIPQDGGGWIITCADCKYEMAFVHEPEAQKRRKGVV